MSAGTITLTNGSAIVGGSETSFATELAAGDFIVSTVGSVSYTLPVKRSSICWGYCPGTHQSSAGGCRVSI